MYIEFICSDYYLNLKCKLWIFTVIYNKQQYKKK